MEWEGGMGLHPLYHSPGQDSTQERKLAPEPLFKLWKSIVGEDGVALGLSTFGKSAPYKDIYKLFNLTSDEIVKITKAKVKK